MLEFRELTYDGLQELGTRLCQEDRNEIFGLGMTVPVALTRTFEMAVEGFEVYDGGVCVGAFGVCQGNDLSPLYRPWLVMAPEGVNYPRQLLYGTQRILSIWLQSYGYLENYVDANHHRAVPWLKRVGFTLLPPEPTGPFGRPFHRFFMGDPDVR